VIQAQGQISISLLIKKQFWRLVIELCATSRV
jgi:hypothetical protein